MLAAPVQHFFLKTDADYGGLPRWFWGKESPGNAGDTGLILGLEDRLEKGMATHSSLLAWRIPWSEEPGGL